ncbi:Uncharacterised protein [Raoultella planticola]|uniref:Uncharacterized protein n=1 Tax=Raoultella planticola TaxID=575 RepID=A0A485CU03_RAOPL|nr:Uncharacterised protein [Raoultella planticola]
MIQKHILLNLLQMQISPTGGHHYQGAKGLLDWNTTDNIGVNATMKVISVNAIERDGLSGQAVQINVKSDKFNGCGLIQFYLEGNLIRRIVIEP